MPDNPRSTFVEDMRARVEEQARRHHEAVHAGVEAKYNLLRVSERRWRVVRVASVATEMFGLQNVITFEQVTEPLPFNAAIATLKAKRGL